MKPLQVVFPSRADPESPIIDLDLHLPLLCFRPEKVLQVCGCQEHCLLGSVLLRNGELTSTSGCVPRDCPKIQNQEPMYSEYLCPVLRVNTWDSTRVCKQSWFWFWKTEWGDEAKGSLWSWGRGFPCPTQSSQKQLETSSVLAPLDPDLHLDRTAHRVLLLRLGPADTHR